jgi:hypothetical protein
VSKVVVVVERGFDVKLIPGSVYADLLRHNVGEPYITGALALEGCNRDLAQTRCEGEPSLPCRHEYVDFDNPVSFNPALAR